MARKHLSVDIVHATVNFTASRGPLYASRALSQDFKSEDWKKVFKYFMRRLTLQGGFDKKKPMWAIVSDVLTARTMYELISQGVI
jgi:hypothetical protein